MKAAVFKSIASKPVYADSRDLVSSNDQLIILKVKASSINQIVVTGYL